MGKREKTSNKDKVDIIVGIPSYNEAENIGFVTKQVNDGLKKYFPNKKSLIVNADNNSVDKTKEVFLSVKTSVPKIYISTRPEVSGKGYNFYNLFNFIKERSSAANVVVDADLKNINPGWIKKMVAPILKGYDFVVPGYHRNRKDGLITNHLCYPLIYGLLGWNISQPIGGDFAFSSGMVNHWLSKKWSSSVYKYGIDIFMTTEAILNDFKVCRVNLGKKIHRMTGPRLNSMFIEVGSILFNQILSYRRFWEDRKIKRLKTFYSGEIKKIHPIIFDYENFQDIFKLGFQANGKIIEKTLRPENYRKLKEIFISGQETLEADLWSKIVYDFILAYEKTINKKELMNALQVISFGRFFAYLKSTEKMGYRKAIQKIVEQARVFLKNRKYLIELN